MEKGSVRSKVLRHLIEKVEREDVDGSGVDATGIFTPFVGGFPRSAPATGGGIVPAGGEETAVPSALANTGANCLPLPLDAGRVDLQKLMLTLADFEINELQVEAGSVLSGALLQAKLVDEILLYQVPVLLSEGGPGLFALGVLESMQERTQLDVIESRQFGEDLRLRLRIRKSVEKPDQARV